VNQAIGTVLAGRRYRFAGAFAAVRRPLVWLPAAAVAWLLLAAVPVLADGGPHMSSINNGSTGITADSCAGCHRAHTAQGPMLLAAQSEEALCLTCHGSGGTGATTDVENGIQYTLASVRGDTVLGALRGGGFLTARIDSDSPVRILHSPLRSLAKVPVQAAGEPVTSSHLDLAAAASATGVAWGNGAISVTPDAGAALDISCGSCHNPHGNGNYRILNPIPHGDDAGPFVEPTTGVVVTDAALPPAGDTRNYTVIQVPGPGYLLLSSQVVSGGYTDTAGDYFHRRVPWNSTTGTSDAPNGLATFNSQMTNWCTTCHSRYYSDDPTVPSGDAIFMYRHDTISNRACTTCHVAHGSNAMMTGPYSATAPYPDGSVPAMADSRLLKIDNRGTCQACHDPTGTIPDGALSGPTPDPLLP
jgi:predicted CXXCH cytochrome family protein